MKKNMIALAVAAAFAAPLVAQAGPDVYGQINMTYGSTEFGTGSTDAIWTVKSIASRMGFKGSMDLDGGMKAVYKLEYGVNPDSTTNAGLTSRNQYLGLSADWGTVLIGYHDTPTKMSQGKFDQFNDGDGDIVGAVKIAKGDLRVGNVLAFVSPKYDAFSFIAAAVAGETAANNGPADTISVAGMYNANNLYVGLGYDSYASDDALLRLTATYKMDAIMVGAMYEMYDANGGSVGDQDMYAVSGAYTMGKNKLKAQYVAATEKGPASTGDADKYSFSLGVDHKLGDKTTGYAMYNRAQDNNGSAANTDNTFYGVGLLHKF